MNADDSRYRMMNDKYDDDDALSTTRPYLARYINKITDHSLSHILTHEYLCKFVVLSSLQVHFLALSCCAHTGR
jgi:hypothetical protein